MVAALVKINILPFSVIIENMVSHAQSTISSILLHNSNLPRYTFTDHKNTELQYKVSVLICNLF